MARLAASAPAPVFAVVGAGARDAVGDLACDPRITPVGAPRPAGVLLLAGELPAPLAQAAVAAHDVMSHPRCTVAWSPSADHEAPARFADVAVVAPPDDVVETVIDCHRRLMTGSQRSEAPLLPDTDPTPWRGEGPYGQGGTGMTGGVPYGRPMADRGDDRDGLALDQLPVKVGPLFAAFPPGLTLDVTLQGDVVQEVAVDPNPFEQGARRPPPPSRPFFDALAGPVAIADVERARARHHLRWLASGLETHGLTMLARRVRRTAARPSPPDSGEVRALGRAVGRTQVLRWATAGVGIIPRSQLKGLSMGPVARAAGIAEDVRSGDPAYQRLGFEPIVHRDGDASARWRQRIAEAAQAAELAETAGDARTGHHGEVEAATGRLTAGSSSTGRLLAMLPQLLAGAEWGDAITTITSLDLDLDEAAAARTGPAVTPS